MVTMKAAVRHEYGPPDVLKIEEVPTPTPRDDELLIRVRAASVNLGDWELLTGTPRYVTVLARIFGPRLRHPIATPPDRSGWLSPRYRILGGDFSGQVEAVGRNVTQFAPGDELFGDCSIGGFGGFAEYVCLPEKAPLLSKPPDMTHEQAGSIAQAAFIAVYAIRDRARVQPGQKVLINGAGGGAGTFAVLLAKHYGAEVTGVDGPHKLEMLRSIGADHVIDYTSENYTENGRSYDAILDLAAYRSVFESRRSLAPGGIYMMAGGSGQATWQAMFLGPWLSIGGRRVVYLLAKYRKEDLVAIVELFAAGKFEPVIERCYPLEETAAALLAVGEKRAKGKVVVTP